MQGGNREDGRTLLSCSARIRCSTSYWISGTCSSSLLIETTTWIWLVEARFQQCVKFHPPRRHVRNSPTRDAGIVSVCSFVLQQTHHCLALVNACYSPMKVHNRRSAWSSPLLCFYYGSSEEHDVRAEHFVSGWRHSRWTNSMIFFKISIPYDALDQHWDCGSMRTSVKLSPTMKM